MPTNNTKQAAWVAIGSFCSFGVGIISSMILSRYFSKGDYGTYHQVLYVYGVLLTVFTLGLPKAYSYFLPRVKPEECKSLINKLTFLFVILGAIFSALLFFGAAFIAKILNNPDLTGAMRIFSVVPLLLMPTMGLEGILSTFKKTQFLALYTICTRLLMLLCIAIPVMIFGLGYKEAIIGFVVSSVITCILAIILKNYPVRNFPKDACNISYNDIFRFSLPLLYASLFGIIISSADQFFISRYFGKEIFAVFANGSMELPFISMVVGACATVLSPIFSRMEHEQVDFQKEVFPLWISVFEKTAKLIYPILAFCWVFSEPIMIVLFGQQYAESSIYFKIKTVTNLFNLIILAPLLINTGKVKIYSNTHAITAVVLIGAEYISIILFNSPYAIAVTSLLCNIAKIFFLLTVVAHIFKIKIYRLFPFKTMLEIIIPSLIFLYGSLIVAKQINLAPWVTILFGLSTYTISFGLYAYFRHINYLSIIKPLFSNK